MTPPTGRVGFLRSSRSGSRGRAAGWGLLLTAGTTALLVGCGSSSSPAPAPSASAPAVSAPGAPASAAVRTVPPPEFLAVAGQQGTVVVDVRTPAEYATGHLQGALNIDVEAPDFADRIAELDPSGTYAVYCRSGNRSSTASQAMAAAGFMHVVNLAGGLADLAAAGADVTR